MERLKLIGNKILSLNGLFSVRTAAKDTGVNVKEVRVVLDRLARAGFLERYELRKLTNPLRGRPAGVLVYQVSRRDELEKKVTPKLKENTAMDRMWKVIRYLRVFSRSDVIRLSESTRENAKWFTKMLHRAGYIKPSKPCGQGVTWKLIKDPGPKRPHVEASPKTRSEETQ